MICVSGSGGGIGGPNGLYYSLRAYLTTSCFHLVQFNTIPRSVEKNVDVLTQLILEKYTDYHDIYLMGWSMGSSIVVNVADYLKNSQRVRAIVLLAPQGAKMENISRLAVPILFIHGTNDHVLSHEISIKLHTKYAHGKDLLLVPDVGHNLELETSVFTLLIMNRLLMLVISQC